MGRIKLTQEKYRVALIHVNKVLNIDSENSYALYTKGLVYFDKENMGWV